MTSSDISTRLKDIRFVRVLWCDNASIIRGKAFHVDILEEHRTAGIGISAAQQAIPAMYDAVVPDSGLGPVGEVWLVPDWNTLQTLPYAVGHGRVLGDMVSGGKAWSLCPRECLRRSIAQAAELGLHVKAAFENEFYLLRSTTHEIVSADSTVFASTLAMDLNQPVIDDISEALLSQGIPVERYYPEAGPGQHEISIRYTDALQAADWQIVFRETVRGVALKHGLRASFLPKIFSNHAGSGCHLHVSLWKDGINLMPDRGSPHGLSGIALSFLAGILHHLPALMAVTTPSPNSYRRLQPHYWSGAFRCWGLDNREAAIRVPSNPTGAPNHIELKTVDATSNPYLALSAVIAAGLDGIRNQRQPDESLQADPGYLSETERRQRKIDRLPANLGEAIEHLASNRVVLDALGSDLAKAFLAVRRAEWEALKDSTLEDEVGLLVERY